jgi:ABC-type multidrug transport system fused ATPase/permease subunit
MLSGLQALKFGTASVEVLYRELCLELPTKTGGASRGAALAPLEHSLTLEAVTYRYPSSADNALESISVIVRRGEAIGLFGPSGVGKTTLVDVILGLLTPDSGVVRVDGQDVLPQLRDWQDQIGYVPQAIFLSDDTLRNNIAFGLPSEEIDEISVRRALKAAQLEDFVRGLPAGLDTVVGERGVRLSGGQRQRIGIARALYNDPAVLVLDEATSALDAETERGVMEAVRALRGLKTVLIVSHRSSTVAYCDRVYLLRRGRVAEETTPQRMFARDDVQQTDGALALS